jgi:hypothetical protein
MKMSKPKASEMSWSLIWRNSQLDVYVAKQDDAYFKIAVFGEKPKYFYGESAWSAVQRYVVDKTGDMKGWSIFS